MKESDRKNHWEHVYKTKELKDVSWYQKSPETSLDFIKFFKIPKNAKIIDVGGGDSFLVDHLLQLGYTDITVLDVSETALKRAKERLGILAENVVWIVADIVDFKPKETYDFWHDRATSHFLTDKAEIDNYIKSIQNNLNPNGILVVGSFSEQGPTKCSGIDVKQYSEESMNNLVKPYFEKIKCAYVDHQTPFDTTQNFIFCGFRKLERTLK
ncbi:class I SAM-dependent methyltransferase [Aquimarina sp. SS2-1]|uniref:class I SAM-dependent methyltransferase n=1 Tax=Aquimarina besae TaxID=3342247 RepID=UPI00366A8FD8